MNSHDEQVCGVIFIYQLFANSNNNNVIISSSISII